MDDKPLITHVTPPDNTRITAAQFWASIPREFEGADICVADENFERVYLVKRIALHKDSTNRKVVVLYTKPVHIQRA